MLGACALILAPARSPARQGAFLPYARVRPILEWLHDALPPALVEAPESQRASAWDRWIAAHDREVRQRLAAGDADTVVNWLLLGTTFTTQPRLDPAAGAPAGPDSGPLVAARVRDLVSALRNPGRDERRLFARALLERQGLRFDTPDHRAGVERHLLTEVVRVESEWRRYMRELEQARSLGDASADFAARSRLFRARGLSLDTSIQPSFALEKALRELQAAGLFASGSVRLAGIIGPGLDFSDKNTGYDIYPQQTLQPFALIDTLRRLDLAGPGPQDLEIHTFDISPRVNDHLARARQRAAAGAAYPVHIPLDQSVAWTPDFLAFWQRAGAAIGSPRRDTISPPPPAGRIETRAVNVRAPVVLQIISHDLNVVTQPYAGARMDLIVATNVLVYYDTLEQSLALSNIAAMLKPGGVFLCNNSLLESPVLPIHSVGYTTAVYSDRKDDGDHVVWYQTAK